MKRTALADAQVELLRSLGGGRPREVRGSKLPGIRKRSFARKSPPEQTWGAKKATIDALYDAGYITTEVDTRKDTHHGFTTRLTGIVATITPAGSEYLAEMRVPPVDTLRLVRVGFSDGAPNYHSLDGRYFVSSEMVRVGGRRRRQWTAADFDLKPTAPRFSSIVARAFTFAECESMLAEYHMRNP